MTTVYPTSAIDIFVNTVFLYSDRFLLTLNYGYGSKTILFSDISSSDIVACGRPNKDYNFDTLSVEVVVLIFYSKTLIYRAFLCIYK